MQECDTNSDILRNEKPNSAFSGPVFAKGPSAEISLSAPGALPEPKLLIGGGSTARILGINAAASEANYELHGILTDQACSINAFVELHPQARKRAYALLDLGYTKSTLTVFAGGNPVFTRQLDCSAESLTLTLVSETGLEYDPAENVMQTMPEKFQEKLAPALEEFANELRSAKS